MIKLLCIMHASEIGCFLQGITNFVLYKFGHLAQKEWQTMYEVAKMFLHCLNHWKLETPTGRKQHAQTDDLPAYKMNYTRSVAFKDKSLGEGLAKDKEIHLLNRSFQPQLAQRGL